MSDYKPRLLIDFDGVIHRYSEGWKDGSTYDSPVSGAKESLAKLAEDYEIVIFSTRDASQINEYLVFFEFPFYRVTNEKEPAVAIIDDRAIRFINWGKALNDIKKYAPIKENN